MVANQGETPGRKLHPNLVTPAGVEPDTNKGVFSDRQPLKLQSRFFDAAPHPLDNVYFVLVGILPQKVLPVAGFRGRAVNHGNVFFYHGAFLHSFG